MKSYLETIAANQNNQGKNVGTFSDYIARGKQEKFSDDMPLYERLFKEILLCQNEEAKLISSWFKKKQKDSWEFHLHFLCCRIHGFKPISEWEAAPKKYRDNYCERVARLARELAGAIEQDVRPGDPPVYLYFDDEFALELINRLMAAIPIKISVKKEDAPLLLAQEAASYAPQELAPILKRFADGMEHNVAQWEVRDKRPLTGNATARALARHLSDYFNETYKKTPNNVIAACVRLMYPDIDPPPGEEDIRQWRGVR